MSGRPPSALHERILEAVARCERLQQENIAVLEAIHTSAEELEQTVDAIHRRRGFGNRQSDAQDPPTAG